MIGCSTGVKSSLKSSSSDRTRIEPSTGAMSSKRSSCAAPVCAKVSLLEISGGGGAGEGEKVGAAAESVLEEELGRGEGDCKVPY